MITDALHEYLAIVGSYPLLTPEQEIDLARKVQAMLALAGKQHLTLAERQVVLVGQRAKQSMVEANMRLVIHVAKKHQGRGLHLLDLTQEGMFGLDRAVEKFDPTKGYRFSTYAYWWIRQSITRGLYDNGRTIRLPVHVTEKLNRAKTVRRQLSQELGRAPRLQEVADRLGLDPEKFLELLSYTLQPTSLDRHISDETELGELLPDAASGPEEMVDSALLQEQIAELLSGLSKSEAYVIQHRYGLLGAEAQSLRQVSEGIGLSRERVRQLQEAALGKLRRRATHLVSYLD